MAGVSHFEIHADDLARDVAEAVARGAHVGVAQCAVPGVGWAAYLNDPFGNIFGLFQADEGARP
jgi:predicted enzyme related to lactoylglutathione lyase